MITNGSFTAGAIAAAQDEGIGLHVVVPRLDSSVLPVSGSIAIQRNLANIARNPNTRVYDSKFEIKSWENDCQAEEAVPVGNVQEWYIAQLKRCRAYRLMLMEKGYDVEASEIVELNQEIKDAQTKPEHFAV